VLGRRDFERLSDIAHATSLGATFRERVRALGDGLARLVPCMSHAAVVVDLRPSRRFAPTASLASFSEGPTQVLLRYAARDIFDDPMLGCARAATCAPVLLSDRAPASVFGKDPYTGDLLPSLGIRYLIGVSCPMADGTRLLFALHRARGDGDFCKRDSAIILRVVPSLRRLAHEAVASVFVERLGLRPIDAVSGLALLDSRGRVLHADSYVRSLAERNPDLTTFLGSNARHLSATSRPAGSRVHRRLPLNGPRGLLHATFVATEVASGVRCLVVLSERQGACERPHATSLAAWIPATARSFKLLPGSTPLTPREHEVALHAVEGASVKQTADRLGVVRSTIKRHREAIYRKTGATSPLELARLRVDGRQLGE